MHKKSILGEVGVLVAILGFVCLTGLVLLIEYRATPELANSTTKAIEASPFLGAIQSLHHWGSGMLIAGSWGGMLWCLGLGMHRVTPKAVWICGTLFFALAMLFQLTGHLLPWDVHAVRTAVVESGIAQGAPLIGPLQANLIRGGASVGPQTLGIWFPAHVVALTILAIVISVVVARRLKGQGLKKRILWNFFYILLLTTFFALTKRPQAGPVATSADFGNYNAAPEWYIMAMHELLGFANNINPSLGFVATMVIPGLIFALVLFAPWIDRSTPEKPSKYGIALSLILLIGLVGLTIAGMRGGDYANPIGPNTYTDSAPAKGGPVAKLDPALIAQGQKLFANSGCLNCHSLNGKGGNAGPKLDGEATRHQDLSWQIAHLNNPKSETPSSTMPAFSYLGADSLKAIAEYLETLK